MAGTVDNQSAIDVFEHGALKQRATSPCKGFFATSYSDLSSGNLNGKEDASTPFLLALKKHRAMGTAASCSRSHQYTIPSVLSSL